MGAKRYRAEEIILKLREADVQAGRGYDLATPFLHRGWTSPDL